MQIKKSLAIIIAIVVWVGIVAILILVPLPLWVKCLMAIAHVMVGISMIYQWRK